MSLFDLESRFPLLDESETAVTVPREATESMLPPRTEAVGPILPPKTGAVEPLLPPRDRTVISRAQGCLLGQLAGDALGSLVEFQTPAQIRRRYPDGVRRLADGGTFNTLAGQPTDDSELALMLARSVVRTSHYSPGEAAVAYALWVDSSPFDCGTTTARALGPAAEALTRGQNPAQVAETARAAARRESQANGALMRVSPLGIYAHALPPAAAASLARDDSMLTHPHAVCRDANAVFVLAIAHAVATGADAKATYGFVVEQTASNAAPPLHLAVRECLLRAADAPPEDYLSHQGWVLVALQNAFWQSLHASTLEEGVCDTVMRGGDTDTNAAIAGALLGAMHGIEAVPVQWREAVLDCRPERGRPGVHQPRPAPFWPVDALPLAQRLVDLGREAARAGARTLP